MTDHQDPLIRIEVVALALNVSMNLARLKAQQGKLPPLSAQIPTGKSHTRAWPLSTIRAHDSELGRRCAAILAVTAPMKPLPPKAA